MKLLPTLLLIAALVLPSAVLAQAARATPSFAQAERNAVELKQGMTLDEVQQLLGKPRRTALRGAALQWTYVWNGSSAASSSSERSLSVEFAAKAADQWFVNGWGWGNY